jgi:2-polyprenyl-3-methyl-5-hydroxy-6-metoxy-1,4-benzoquinol methylase
MVQVADSNHRRTVERDFDSRVDEWRTIYDGRSFHDDAIRERLHRVIEYVRDRRASSGERALDVGCGAGQLLDAMLEHGYGAHGTDIAFGMAVTSRESRPSPLTQSSADALPYRTGAFGLVTALGLIEYVPHPEDALREMQRVLAPGTHLVVTAPNPVRLGYLIDPVGVVMTLLKPPKGGYKRRYWNPRALRRAVEDADFRVDAIVGHGIGPIHFARRPIISEERSIRLGRWLERHLPATVVRWLGANLIVFATKRG